MSHFYGRMHGKARTPATRCGSTDSGIHAHLSGWDVGVKVSGYVISDEDPLEDVFMVSFTRGSNNPIEIPAIYVALNREAHEYRVLTLSGGPSNVEKRLNGWLEETDDVTRTTDLQPTRL